MCFLYKCIVFIWKKTISKEELDSSQFPPSSRDPSTEKPTYSRKRWLLGTSLRLVDISPEQEICTSIMTD